MRKLFLEFGDFDVSAERFLASLAFHNAGRIGAPPEWTLLSGVAWTGARLRKHHIVPGQVSWHGPSHLPELLQMKLDHRLESWLQICALACPFGLGIELSSYIWQADPFALTSSKSSKPRIWRKPFADKEKKLLSSEHQINPISPAKLFSELDPVSC